MMYGYYGANYGSMMGGVGLLGLLGSLIILIDLTLIGVWLWQKVTKNQHDR